MCLCRRPFRWSCRGVEAKHVASPDAACPELHQKPLDAAIGQLLALYHPGGRHGDSTISLPGRLVFDIATIRVSEIYVY